MSAIHELEKAVEHHLLARDAACAALDRAWMRLRDAKREEEEEAEYQASIDAEAAEKASQMYGRASIVGLVVVIAGIFITWR